jgi:hypothetical protein
MAPLMALLLAAALPLDQSILSQQVTLDRLGFSPGVIDGKNGPQTRHALAAWQQANGLPATEEPAELPVSMLFTNYTVTTNDTAQLGPWPKDWLERSRLPRMTCETIGELLAERFHCKEALLQELNPQPGEVWKVPNTAFPLPARKAARVRVYLGSKFVRAFDAQDRLLAHFPCSIPASPEKRTPASLTVANIALPPNYTFDPVVFPELDAQQKSYGKLIIAPGPNNPVGTAWIGLSKAGYGIHGTPHPEDIGKTESHGCFRLANWNAERLARMVEIGTPVEVLAE